MNPIQSPKHDGVRRFLRIAGPVTVAIGAVFTLIGVGSLIVASARHSGPPVLFFCAFIGLPLLFAGTVMCMIGFLGAMARYVAAEQAPVAKDTINYMADGTQEAVRTVARAAAQGVAEGIRNVPAEPNKTGKES